MQNVHSVNLNLGKGLSALDFNEITLPRCTCDQDLTFRRACWPPRLSAVFTGLGHGSGQNQISSEALGPGLPVVAMGGPNFLDIVLLVISEGLYYC